MFILDVNDLGARSIKEGLIGYGLKNWNKVMCQTDGRCHVMRVPSTCHNICSDPPCLRPCQKMRRFEIQTYVSIHYYNWVCMKKRRSSLNSIFIYLIMIGLVRLLFTLYIQDNFGLRASGKKFKLNDHNLQINLD